MRRLPAQTRIVNHDLQIAGKQKGRVAVGFSTSRPCDGRVASTAAAVSFNSAPLPAPDGCRNGPCLGADYVSPRGELSEDPLESSEQLRCGKKPPPARPRHAQWRHGRQMHE